MIMDFLAELLTMQTDEWDSILSTLDEIRDL